MFQYGYSLASNWLTESTAEWAEAQVWPELHDYTLTSDWMATPYLPLWQGSSNYRAYGAQIFWFYSDQATEPGLATGVIKRLCTEYSIDSLESELESRGTNLDTQLVQFALWNNMTWIRDDGEHYQQGSQLPPVATQNVHTGYPVISERLSPELVAREAGSNYIRFKGPGNSDTLEIAFEGHPYLREHRKVSFVLTKNRNQHTEMTVTPDEFGKVRVKIPNWNELDEVTMIVTNFRSAKDFPEFQDFSYSASEGSPPPYSSPASISSAPNPFKQQTVIHFEIDDSIENTKLEIFDVNGRRISTLVNRALPQGSYDIIWNAEDDSGTKLSSGIYFAVLNIGHEREVFKIALTK